MNSELEVVDYTPPSTRRSLYGETHLELMQMLLKIPPGKSIRKRCETVKSAKSFSNATQAFIRKQKLTDTYFVTKPSKPEQDGKFYVYIGKRK